MVHVEHDSLLVFMRNFSVICVIFTVDQQCSELVLFFIEQSMALVFIRKNVRYAYLFVCILSCSGNLIGNI